MVTLTEAFVNTCCKIVLSENRSIPASLISDISEIINNIDEKSIPLLFRKKFQLLNTLVELKCNDPNVDKATLLDSVLSTGYFNEVVSYVDGLDKLPLTDEQVSKCIQTILNKKSLINIEKNGDTLETFINRLKTNEFKNVDEVTKEWERLISSVHTDIINKERNKNLHDVTDLDLLDDDYEPVVNQIKLSYSGVNSISTGYDSLDCHMYGGFAPARLYMFCAPSGGSKSVMLINLVKNAVDRNLRRKDDRQAVYIYATLENLVDESLLRLYSCLSGKTTDSIVTNIDKEKHVIAPTVKAWQNENNARIKFKYFKPQQTNCFDILNYCNDFKANHPNCDIKAIYIDYLDLMKPNLSSRNSDAYRLELGQISIDMKTLAVLLRVPVVTCTQVNRAAYDPNNKMNLANVSESMKKVDNADWIAMLQPREEDDEKAGTQRVDKDEKIMDCKITKSRFGHKDVSVPFKSNFKRFRFDEYRKDTGLEIDEDLLQRSEEDRVAKTVVESQNSMYSDDDTLDMTDGGII